MAKIEAKDVFDSLDKHEKYNEDALVPGNPESVAFYQGYKLACDHIREIVNVLNIGAEIIEKIKEGGKA